MTGHSRTWRDELRIIDRTMRAISAVSDPEQLIDIYWNGIGNLLPIRDYVAVSRRAVEPPYYLVTRSSRFVDPPNPWTERHRLPRLRGGILGELAFADRPVIINDLADRLAPDDPGHPYLHGFHRLIALPQYDAGEALNVSVILLAPGEDFPDRLIPMLHWQNSLFGRGTQNLVLRNQLSATLAELDRELAAVGDIQRSLLPQSLPAVPGFELAASYRTSARAGGDYYDIFPLDDGSLGLFIADVSGHGTPAAVLMAITHALAHCQPWTHTPPAALLARLNEQLARCYTREGDFVTAFYAILDPATRKLTYSCAGHNPPRLVRAGRVHALQHAASLPLAISPELEYTEAHLRLEPADLLLLYTDGITEALTPDPALTAPAGTNRPRRELFGTERLDRVLLEHPEAALHDLLQHIHDAAAVFAGDTPLADDQTLLALRCNPR